MSYQWCHQIEHFNLYKKSSLTIQYDKPFLRIKLQKFDVNSSYRKSYRKRTVTLSRLSILVDCSHVDLIIKFQIFQF